MYEHTVCPFDLPQRLAASHKGLLGTVVVVGGQQMMPGAPAMTARAAFRSGVGLVKVVSDFPVIQAVLAIEPCATGLTWQQAKALDQQSNKQVWAIGPGLGAAGIEGDSKYAEGNDWLAWLFDFKSDKPGSSSQGFTERDIQQRRLVLDADGLNQLAAACGDITFRLKLTENNLGEHVVLTPHPGEFRRLADGLKLPLDSDASVVDEKRPEAARLLAQTLGCHVLLKGQHTVVTDGQAVYINQTGHPALAVAGSGDVLTGLIAGLMAQGLSGFQAACLGAWAHGRAGELWAAEHGQAGLRAIELADYLPKVLDLCRK